MAISDYTEAAITTELESIASDLNSAIVAVPNYAQRAAQAKILVFRQAVNDALVTFGCDPMNDADHETAPYEFSAGQKTLIAQLIGNGPTSNPKTGWPRIYWKTAAQTLVNATQGFPENVHPDLVTDPDSGDEAAASISDPSVTGLTASILAQANATVTEAIRVLRNSVDAACVAFGADPRIDDYTFSDGAIARLAQVAKDAPDNLDWTAGDYNAMASEASALAAEFETFYTAQPVAATEDVFAAP